MQTSVGFEIICCNHFYPETSGFFGLLGQLLEVHLINSLARESKMYLTPRDLNCMGSEWMGSQLPSVRDGQIVAVHICA